MVVENGGLFTSFGGNTYRSDIVRACVRPFASQASKLAVKHLRETYKGKLIIPENGQWLEF